MNLEETPTFQYRSTPRDDTTLADEENSEGPMRIRLSEVVSALSYALDLTEGQPIGHAVKSCVLGMRLADKIGLSREEKADLYYALLLKDMGCSSNAARIHQIFGGNEQSIKADFKTTDWTRLPEGFAYVRRHAAIGQSLYQRFLRIVKIAAGSPGQARQWQVALFFVHINLANVFQDARQFAPNPILLISFLADSINLSHYCQYHLAF